jgi:GNAT superfamily N-acetyltransferase
VSSDITISALARLSDRELDGLCDVLIDCVEGGDSIGFMLPITRSKAEAYWRGAAESAARGERVILLARDSVQSVIGTVSVVWAQPENQPHRADIAKMQVHRSARRKGVGAALLNTAERVALEAGKTLLVLDTASADAERLYARHQWVRSGVIPNYALMPDGPYCSTTVFYKSLSAT